MKEINKSKIIRIIHIILILALIFTIYSFGRLRGTIEGISFGATLSNNTICNIFQKERDIDGYCILSNKSKFTMKLDCGYEKFITIGKESIPSYLVGSQEIKRWIYYPIIGC